MHVTLERRFHCPEFCDDDLGLQTMAERLPLGLPLGLERMLPVVSAVWKKDRLWE